MRIPLRILLCCFFVVANVPVAHPSEMHGMVLPDRYDCRCKEDILILRGIGDKRLLLFKIFVAGLYLRDDTPSAEALEDVPKRLEVAYFVKIPGKRLAQETRKRIIQNTTPEEYARIKARVDIMDGYFVDISPGDHFSNTYVPGMGTRFVYNGRLIGEIEGADFAKALFAVWVGGHPIDETLRARLLGFKQEDK
ncbi:MAG: chalcone isomerase family protein [Candidatus Omnitrophota bacterium]